MAGNRRFRPGGGFGRQLDVHETRVGVPPPAEPAAPPSGGMADSAVYIRGHRFASPSGLAETYRCLQEQEQDGAMAWIGLYRPDIDQITSLAREFRLHDLAVEDAINAHQRPKLERYGDTLFVVLRAARYDDLREEVEFSELHLFIGSGFVVTVRHGEAPDLAAVRRRMETDAPMLARGPEAVLYAILDQVVDGYAPVVAGLENDIDEIETQVFGGDPNASRRIYGLSREVIQFQRAARPLLTVLGALADGAGSSDEELRRYLRDVTDHLTQVVERVDGFRHLLQNILTVNATLVSQQQNEEMRSLTAASYAQNEELKKVSSWAAILFAPTLIGTVYGMNFVHMPELNWRFGYLFALLLMVLVCGTLYLVFKRRGWL
ncbi:magnesium/cobalt transporter CorA [Micromonospora sp. ALFpr18c]|uniref:magnesium/cobalt transporter CorA n=1 Tax=unclassified Micromonospora TaxID=2617518 RepID=UPI001788B423|nr:magnesium/cobalt transporter CorA [Micromonospora sp. ALFpr18c]